MASNKALLHAVRDVALAVGAILGPDRQAVIVHVLREENFSAGELSASVRHLTTSKDLSDEIRFGGTLTPAHFVEARRSARRRLASQRRARLLPRRSYVDPATLDEDGYHMPPIAYQLVEANHGGEAREKKAIPAASPISVASAEMISAPPVPVTRCEEHPTRELFTDGFCAECEVERIAEQEKA